MVKRARSTRMYACAYTHCVQRVGSFEGPPQCSEASRSFWRHRGQASRYERAVTIRVAFSDEEDRWIPVGQGVCWGECLSRFLGGEKAVCGSFRAVGNTATALGAIRTTHETRR